MQQHAAAKRAHPDCIVFFRLGDFYEMFGDDAVVVSGALDLTLTSRNRGKPDEIPMAGVPHHAAHGYIARLLDRGFKVAICEQMADPSTVKGIVPREVVRVITPGTWTEADQLTDGENHWLCAIELGVQGVGVALLDLSTAELVGAELPDLTAALAELGRMRPREVLVASSLPVARVETKTAAESPAKGRGKKAKAPEAETSSASSASAPSASAAKDLLGDEANEALREVVGSTAVRTVASLGEAEALRVLAGIELPETTPLVRAALGQVLAYARHCFQGKPLPVFRAGVWNASGVLGLDRAAQRHLELVESTVGDRRATLLSVLERTQTAGGARLLRRRLLAPLTDVALIRRRLDQVETLVKNGIVRAELRDALDEVTDLERLGVRATLGEANPRDLGAIGRGLRAARAVVGALVALPDLESRETLGVAGEVDVVPELAELLGRALVARPPALAKEGAIFQEGYDADLDHLAALRLSGTEAMSRYETELRERTGLSQLRVRFTRVFGWYVEVSRSQAGKVPAEFRRKQTVATGERYTLPELDELAEQIASAEDRFRERELALLSELTKAAVVAAPRLHSLSALLSTVDVAAALAEIAIDLDYCRPDVDDSNVLELVDARHPVVERLAAKSRFVPNDVTLEVGREHLWLISGPNMAGKSTFLRQVALAVVLAQMGSFVPASRARIGVVDRVLSRVGASDNLAGGESTFMVEMRETATILRTASSRSLVILDEVGRGTSTLDGLAIAWSVVEHLDQTVGCRALFATHYHELTTLGSEAGTCRNYSVSAREHGADVVFLHRVTAGAASRSYGVHVAKLAGLPEPVLARARALLSSFEGDGVGKRVPAGPQRRQLDLFASESSDPTASEIAATMRELDLDRLTGVEALGLLAQFQRKLRG